MAERKEKLIRNEREAIECINKNRPQSGYNMLKESLDMAVVALEKQIPKKPGQNIFDEDSMTCICGSDIDKDVEFRFCPWCGQRITDI